MKTLSKENTSKISSFISSMNKRVIEQLKQINYQPFEVKNTYKGQVNQVKATLVVNNHLNDCLTEIDYNLRSLLIENTTVRIGFIKYLINELNGNLDQYIDPNKMFIEYRQKYLVNQNVLPL